ncbi:MAG: hypothetical protein IPP36_07705 [Nitrosomonadales bacterium]|nr:hypothetical protein [Nitrosomonadales bacterium]
MPLWDEYQPQLDSNFADIQTSADAQAAGITAACFPSRFTKDHRRAHRYRRYRMEIRQEKRATDVLCRYWHSI